MLSKSGKVEWSCPDCGSKDIERVALYGINSMACKSCRMWRPWRERIKRSIAGMKHEAVKRHIAGMKHESPATRYFRRLKRGY